MSKLSNGTWVLVADGDKALFLENVTDAQAPNLVVRRVEEQDNPANRDQQSDRPGRMPDVGPGQRSGMEEADWHRLGKERFAAEMADILYRLAHRGAFDRLVLVAPPRTLGALREHLHKEVAQRVVAEIGKDLTNHPGDKLEKVLLAELAGT
ncbi:host attachment family protein [Roseovarius autotrophicus]|uniref:host attachment family protein n=1 Tax=Roseovarius autotrophicus TaxID=2824121 RepID=UPI001A0FD7D7|nr:host attachment family protein [Roseovarius autotrophicus]MBE0453861.1 host attachment protein [Roseovarius sp.]